MRHHHTARCGHNWLGNLCGSRFRGDSGHSACHTTTGGCAGLRRYRGLLSYGCGRCRCFRDWRSGNDGRLDGNLFFPCSRSRGWLHNDPSRRWRHNNNRARRNGPWGSLGNNRACRRTRGNSRNGWRRSNNRGRRARLRNNLPRFRLGRRGHNCFRGNGNNGGGRCRFRRRHRSRLPRNASVARLFFLFFFLGLNSLQHVSRFGNVREIDLGSNGFSGVASVRAARMRCTL